MSSYIQVELDAFNTFPLIARATGLPVEIVSHGMLSLWAHCYRHKVEEVRPLELRGLFGPCKDLAEVLEAFNFVEPMPNGSLRVRGVGRYERVNEARREAGRKGGLKSAATRQALQRNNKGRFLPASTEATPKQTLRPATDETEAEGTTVAVATPKHELPLARDFATATVGDGVLPSSPKQTLGADPSKPLATLASGLGLTQALEPRGKTLSLSEPKRESFFAGGRATPTAPPVDLSAERPHIPKPPPEWPTHECENAGLAWYDRLREARPMGHAWTVDDAKRVAMEFPAEFGEAVSRMCEASKPWVGYRTDLVSWLRRECQFVEAERSDRAKREAKKRQAEVAPGDRYTPRYRPEPGATPPVFERSPPNTSPEPKGAITPDATWDAVWAAAAASMKGPGYLDRDEHAECIAPLTALGVSHAGELVLAAATPEFRQATLDGLWGSFVVPAVERELERRKLPQSPLRITAQGTKARGAA